MGAFIGAVSFTGSPQPPAGEPERRAGEDLGREP